MTASAEPITLDHDQADYVRAYAHERDTTTHNTINRAISALEALDTCREKGRLVQVCAPDGTPLYTLVIP